MKVKKFKNLWAMGLILFGVILVALYTIKIFFPKFIVGIAEIPSIVSFGNYVDSHKWAYYLFYFTTSVITMFFYCCACCKTKRLRWQEWIAISLLTIISYPIETLLPNLSFAYNNIMYILMPLSIVILRKDKSPNIFYSTAICFIITSLAQVMSLEIRDISTMITNFNTGTFFVLIIDGTIWYILLYLFFNYKKGDNKNG